jgi:hypothetical protein
MWVALWVNCWHLSLFILIQKRNIVLPKLKGKRIGLCPLGQNKLEYLDAMVHIVWNGWSWWMVCNNKNNMVRKQESQSLSLCIGCDIVMQLIYLEIGTDLRYILNLLGT